VDNVAPSVVVARAPVSGTRGIRKTAYVTARAADTYGISRMELLVNGKVAGRYTGALRQFPVQTWVFGASLRVQVRAYDRAGNVRYTPVRTWYR
jgi:thermitase